MLLDSMQSLFDVTTVGMPTGGKPVGFASETPFVLPNSGLMGSVSNRLHVDSASANDERPWIAPSFVAWPNGQQWRNGEDVALDKVLELIAAKE